MVVWYNRAMAGSPIKHERNRLVREAILHGLEEGVDPVEYLIPYANRLKKMALKGKLGSAVTLGAIKEIHDRVDGKAAQEIVGLSGLVPTLVIEIMGMEQGVEKEIGGEQLPALVEKV